MDRSFPAFSTNYPATLMSLSDYVRQAQAGTVYKPPLLDATDAVLGGSSSGGGAGETVRGASATMRSTLGGGPADDAAGATTAGTTSSMWRTVGTGTMLPSLASPLKSPGLKSAPSFRMTDAASAARAGASSPSAGGGGALADTMNTTTTISAATAAASTGVVDLSNSSTLTDEEVRTALTRRLRMDVLTLRYSFLPPQWAAAVATHGARLMELDLSGCLNLKAADVVRVVQSCPHLKVLHLGRNDMLFKHVADGVEVLSSLAIPSVNLLDLRLNFNVTLVDKALLAFTRAAGPADLWLTAPGRSGSVSTASVGASSTWYYDTQPAPAATGGFPASVTFMEPEKDDEEPEQLEPLPLECLDLSGCTSVSDAGIIHVLRRAPWLRQLRLQLLDQVTVTSATLEAAATHCPRLESVDIAGSIHMTSHGIIKLISHCTNLQSLAVAGVGATDSVCRALAGHCPNLTMLDFARCIEISKEGIQAVLTGCTALSHLNISMCPGIPDAELPGLQRISPDLTITRHGTTYADPTAAALLPGFKPPPMSQQWKSVKQVSVWKVPKGAKKGKGKGKKK